MVAPESVVLGCTAKLSWWCGPTVMVKAELGVEVSPPSLAVSV